MICYKGPDRHTSAWWLLPLIVAGMLCCFAAGIVLGLKIAAGHAKAETQQVRS
jgi:hypothetical protein